MSAQEIAQMLGVSTRTIFRYLQADDRGSRSDRHRWRAPHAPVVAPGARTG
ncbi:MAG: HTH domain-containing protein [Singulisphaera sp.]|nr:HTH domain-containing protein [Singulisphaera sp.]